jgi:hypothetical protein
MARIPWTIPSLLLHDKPVPLANMRNHGRNHAFVYCSNPACHHSAELDVSRLPDDVTFNLQPRVLCTVCDAAARQPSPAPNGGGLDVTLPARNSAF